MTRIPTEVTITSPPPVSGDARARRIHRAALALYQSGFWQDEHLSEDYQKALWEDLREALGLPPNNDRVKFLRGRIV